MTTAVVFFLVLSMFTLVVVFSANTLLLQRERQNVNNTISKVVTYIEKDWDSDEELSPEPLLAALYSPKNIYPVSYTHLRAHETRHDLVCRLLLEKKKNKKKNRMPTSARTME